MVEDGLASVIPKPDVALAQHVLAYPAGTVGTHAGPDPVRRGQHAHHRARTGQPRLDAPALRRSVVLAAMIVVRLQTIVAREVEARATSPSSP